eukprot:m.175979 g.175979  ORF g.175979 m.175979 type:complete len:161 (+) comp15434_c0_seq27:1932-2414(+)
MVQLTQRPENFFQFVCILLMNVLCAQSYGMFVATLADTIQSAQRLSAFLIIVLMLFGGFYLNLSSIWPGFQFIEVFSFIQYCFTALCINEFAGLKFACDAGQDSTYCLVTGEQVLTQAGMSGRTVAGEIGKLFALAVLFRILAYLLLRFKGKRLCSCIES